MNQGDYQLKSRTAQPVAQMNQIQLDEGGAYACDLLDAVEHLDVGVGEVVDDNDLIPGID